MEMFNCPLPSVSVNNRKWKVLQKFSASENIICRHCADCAKSFLRIIVLFFQKVNKVVYVIKSTQQRTIIHQYGDWCTGR